MEKGKMSFRAELRNLINRHSKESGSNTPDWILADYLCDCLKSFDYAYERREEFYSGKEPTNEEG